MHEEGLAHWALMSSVLEYQRYVHSEPTGERTNCEFSDFRPRTRKEERNLDSRTDTPSELNQLLNVFDLDDIDGAGESETQSGERQNEGEDWDDDLAFPHDPDTIGVEASTKECDESEKELIDLRISKTA